MQFPRFYFSLGTTTNSGGSQRSMEAFICSMFHRITSGGLISSYTISEYRTLLDSLPIQCCVNVVTQLCSLQFNDYFSDNYRFPASPSHNHHSICSHFYACLRIFTFSFSLLDFVGKNISQQIIIIYYLKYDLHLKWRFRFKEFINNTTLLIEKT